MSLSVRNLAVIALVLIGLTWWMLREDPQAQVLRAHAELREQILKADDEAAPALLLKSRALADLFADPCELSGAAGGLIGVYSPEELADAIVRVRTLFDSIDLQFGELAIEFPNADEAVAEFSADLIARSAVSQAADTVELRYVRSHLRRVDGNWLFSGFQLTEQGASEAE